MAFLLQAPANTNNYMIAGYVVIFGLMGLYLISLVVRSRSTKQDMEVLQELEAKSAKKGGQNG